MNLPAARRLHGLVAATHTPFHADGSLHLDVVEQQAAHFLNQGILTVFIGGTTGESSSLTLEERLALAERWLAVAKDSPLRVVVHVGSNCLADARSLAAQAEKLGAVAISMLAPSYFKPRSLDILIACCADVASAAPQTPFYYYDIPSMTGVSFSMPDFLEKAESRIPTLAGLKFTNPDLMAYQFCLRSYEGRWDVPFGVDEHLLGALAMGAKGAVGSGFNFAGPLYSRLFSAFKAGDLEAARKEQFRGIQLIDLFSGPGYMAAAKATMEMLGVNVGPPRLPNGSLSPDQTMQLRRDLEGLGFFDWIN
ncbi:MAG TPA: dihydrodipicolinate synthase family protein [Verrucomicrobiales bacterium]|jgi:N-acetylneuraminate lyase|nr:dihydrodipicolinate synthase family protein [Verrucomicrobiales bacterium]